MLDDMRALPESLRENMRDQLTSPLSSSMNEWLSHDERTEAYWAGLRELEARLNLLSLEYGGAEQCHAEPRHADDGAPLELTDYLFIEDA